MNKQPNPNPNPNSDFYSFSRVEEKFSKLDVYIPEWLEYKISGKEWISWGSNNLMPQYLITMRDSSAIHNAILTKKELYTYGNGLQDGKSIDCFTYGTAETLKAIISDFYVFGMWAINVVWSMDGKSIAHAEHIDMSKLRAGKKTPMGKIDHWYYSNNFADTRKPENKAIRIDAYDPKNPVGSQIYVYHGYAAGYQYYNKPSYYSSICWINLDYEIGNFHLNNVRAGFAASMAVIFNEMPDSQEERDYIYAQLQQQYAGSTAAGSVFIIFNRDKETGVELKPIELNSSDQRYETLMEIVRNNIMSGHNVVGPALFGISTPGALSARTELDIALEILMNTEIAPNQKLICETLQRVLRLDFMPELTTTSPVQFIFSESVMKEILTQDELRELISYPPLTEDQDTVTDENIDRAGEAGLDDLTV
jgi:hypothetical protein